MNAIGLKNCVIKLLILVFFLLNSVPDRYKTQKISDKATDGYLAALTFFPDFFVISKMLEKFHDALNASDGVFDKDFSKITFFANQMGILRVDLDKINLNNYNNFQEGNPDTIVHAKSLAWHNKFEKRKEFKENLSEELMPVAWHPAKLWDWCLSEDEKKGVQSTFTQSWKVGKSSTEAIGNSKS